MKTEVLRLLGVASSAVVATEAVFAFVLWWIRRRPLLSGLAALTASSAAAYGFVSSIQTGLGTSTINLAAERLTILMMLVLAPSIMALARTLDRGGVGRFWFVAPCVSIVFGVLGVFTNLVVAGTFVMRDFSLLGPTADASSGPVAPVCFAYLIACGMLSGMYFLRYARRERVRLSVVIHVGTALYLLTGLHDILVKQGVLNTGFLFPYGVLGCAGIIATVALAGHVATVEIAERAASDLASAVEAKTRELKDAQARLTQEHHLAALGRLSAGVAHEINNPLGVIQANLTFFQDTILNVDHSPQLRAALLESVEACRRASQIIKDLSLLSRKSRDLTTRLRLADPVGSAIRFLTRSHPLASAVQTNIDPDVIVRGDETGLGQVAANLLQNALQAIEEQKGEKGLVKVEIRRDPPFALLVIDDTGPGVSDDLKSQIFDPFFTTKDVRRGTGLGLSICASIVADHMGTIHVEDAPSGGARFVVRIPLASEKDDGDPRADGAAGSADSSQ